MQIWEILITWFVSIEQEHVLYHQALKSLSVCNDRTPMDSEWHLYDSKPPSSETIHINEWLRFNSRFKIIITLFKSKSSYVEKSGQDCIFPFVRIYIICNSRQQTPMFDINDPISHQSDNVERRRKQRGTMHQNFATFAIYIDATYTYRLIRFSRLHKW